MKMRARRVKTCRHPLRMQFHKAVSAWSRVLGVPIRAFWSDTYGTGIWPQALYGAAGFVDAVMPEYTPEEAEWVESLNRRINEAMTAHAVYLTSFYPLREGDA